MFPLVVVVNIGLANQDYRAFTITVYCKTEDFEQARLNASEAAANAAGVILAECSQDSRLPNGDELDLLEEVAPRLA